MRIAIVNDMPLAVEAMRRVVLHASAHSLAWIARDGAQAVERCATDVPDLILMDLIMPVMDGIEATRQIMEKSPCAILIVTASVGQNSAKVFEAMGAGALDTVRTPVLGANNGNGAAALLYKIDSIGRLIGRHGAQDASQATARPGTATPAVPLVAIGASAGGPAALASILAALPRDFAAGIVVVQHVDAQFVQGLANWLGTQSALPVRIASEADQITPGTVLVAGGDDHLVFRDRVLLGYTNKPVECNYRPSVDVFFDSVARLWRGRITAVLLTGMGRDGAAGLKTLREAGHHTIAQDRASSAVYGMPKAAADLGAAAEVLSLEKIAPALVRTFGQTSNNPSP